MLDITKLLEEKRAAFVQDSDYIEELERMLFVTDESYNNVEAENEKLRANSNKVKFLYTNLEDYEEIVGFQVNSSFKTGWRMARNTNAMLGLTQVNTEYLEYLEFFVGNSDFGPAQSDIEEQINEMYREETGKEVPDGY